MQCLLVKISGSLCSCLLPDSIQATTVKQLPEYHGCSGVCILFHLMFILVYTGFFPSQLTYANFFFWMPIILVILFTEDGVTKTLSTTTPCESIELDDEQEKSLLSPLAGTDNNVSIVKEAQTTQVK